MAAVAQHEELEHQEGVVEGQEELAGPMPVDVLQVRCAAPRATRTDCTYQYRT